MSTSQALSHLLVLALLSPFFYSPFPCTFEQLYCTEGLSCLYVSSIVHMVCLINHWSYPYLSILTYPSYPRQTGIGKHMSG
ncbi:hypothetical protein BKA64DRAFT_132038 [Cadophora sp. MPI-SDFR-AT-0126]|nr:hypothetical protein BKA64DRAFT_132038 [Leotiomycetes sp. MPI-SDFR-AT-0126]